MRALGWLQSHNDFYRQIAIIPCRLEALPEDGIPEGLACLEEDDGKALHPLCVLERREIENVQDRTIPDQEASGPGEGRREGVSNEPLQTRDVEMIAGVANITESIDKAQVAFPEETFIGEDQRRALERNQIMATLNSRPPIIDWPSMGNQPINEFTEVCLAAKCFPTLFPTGTGDPTSRDREISVSEANAFRHLMKYGEKKEDGKMTWRFAAHPRFTQSANN